ncbi:hypothetical protein BIW11_11360 [Tropilaelaps mercedesae]|uniref:Uncharacterized protein n=1 Tax=Tropilaelaps mercedesae TaxID=418985 RepID=A0A1V9XBQ3_9ACAR|nr:hypothetical protein BIW11_11360 [Tropilaelaps mercedesae]
MYAIFRASLLFFDTVPTGQVLGRLSKDVDMMDIQLGYLQSRPHRTTHASMSLFHFIALLSVCASLENFPAQLSLDAAAGVGQALADAQPFLRHGERVATIRTFRAEQNFVEEFATRLHLSQNYKHSIGPLLERTCRDCTEEPSTCRVYGKDPMRHRFLSLDFILDHAGRRAIMLPSS